MSKRSQEFISHAEDLLRQFAQTADDDLSTILSAEDLEQFQKKSPKESASTLLAKPCHSL